MRGRKPTPVHLKVLQGNPGKRRLPQAVPGVGELGGPPSEWKPLAKALWHELAEELPHGVAARADRLAFEMVVRLVSIVRQDPTALTPAMAAQIRVACSEFGMTPSARVRLPEPPGPPSKFDRLIGADPAGEFFRE